MVDPTTLEYVHSLLQTVSNQQDWKSALDTLLASLREEFVYDNVAVYLYDPHSQTLDVGYARAVGRGKDAEADISWGEGIAGKVVSRQQAIVQRTAWRSGCEPFGCAVSDRSASLCGWALGRCPGLCTVRRSCLLAHASPDGGIDRTRNLLSA